MGIVSREPWPANGIETYNCIEDGPWGYLLYTVENGFEFDSSTRPTDREIIDRWGSRLKSSELVDSNE